jgi:hypothetical protein
MISSKENMARMRSTEEQMMTKFTVELKMIGFMEMLELIPSTVD